MELSRSDGPALPFGVGAAIARLVKYCGSSTSYMRRWLTNGFKKKVFDHVLDSIVKKMKGQASCELREGGVGNRVRKN